MAQRAALTFETQGVTGQQALDLFARDDVAPLVQAFLAGTGPARLFVLMEAPSEVRAGAAGRGSGGGQRGARFKSIGFRCACCAAAAQTWDPAPGVCAHQPRRRTHARHRPSR